MLRFLRLLLLPLSGLYAGIMAFRNWLYNQHLKKSHHFTVPVISVGNLTVGGTGKTPHVEYLLRLLRKDWQLATLSRGYGRKTKGFLLANERATAQTIGDEPYQLYCKFGPEVTVAVGERRAEAIPRMMREKPQTQAIILDDAYQHRSVTPHLSILLTDYHRPFYRDYVMPAGRLRESRSGARRADIVIVTKCPLQLQQGAMEQIERKIRQYSSSGTPVFFTGIRYGEPITFGNKNTIFHPEVVLVSGLANPAPLEDYVRQHFHLLKHIAYRDHHHYRLSDVAYIQQVMQETKARSVLVTEKDYVKLVNPDLAAVTSNIPLFYLPIEVTFLKEKPEFDTLILNVLRGSLVL